MAHIPPSVVDTPEVSAKPPTPDDVRSILAGVMDPELHASITDLGMVRDITVSVDGGVTIGVALTTAGCPLRHQIRQDVESKVRGLPGVRDVAVDYAEMTETEKSEVMQRARWEARDRAPETEVSAGTRVIAVASGKGGVGKSSITVNVAAALAARGLTVGVLDADIWGFSVPRMLGVDERLGGAEGKIEPHVIEVPNEDTDAQPGAIKVVSMGFLVDDEQTALMWRGLVLSRALEQFLTDVRWGELEYLLIDMPPGTGDIQMALSRLLPSTEILVVTTPASTSQKVATRVADMARRSYLKVMGVIENMAAYVAPDGSRHEVFGTGGGAALAKQIDAPLVGTVPLEPALSEGSDAGTPVVLSHPDSAAARELRHIATEISERLLPPVEMSGCTARIFETAAATLAESDKS
jgi:ATP-binding protein involved in chromosome partitioning